MNRPRVGVTAYRAEVEWGGTWRKNAAFIPDEYLDFATAGGGVPVVLPALAGHAEEAVDGIDALILSGGPDVAPERYRAAQDAQAENTDLHRDSWDFAVLRAALERDLPVLAICRGLQVLNVAYGGTLHQHVPNVVQSNAHRISVGTFQRNTVRVVPGSKLESIIGAGIAAPCHHHQSVAEVGAGLVPCAYATDGVIEALEDTERAFVVGVQWHPEEDADVSLSEALVSAATSRNQARSGAWERST